MSTNILKCFLNLAKYISQNTMYSESIGNYNNRINNMGEDFENLIKDSLCNSFTLTEQDRMIKYNEYLSWSGNQNNPPDLIIKGGDAIEIKKMGGEDNIMLNMLMLKSKYDAFPSTFKQELEKLSNVKSVKIADPNNPSNLLDAMFVDYQIQ